jgi:hypothetical protein
VSDEERLTDQVLDIFVYAPIGLALEARELIPKLADRGRGQVALTRLAGKVAGQQGQGEARKLLDQAIEVVSTVLSGEAGDPPIHDEEILDLTGDDELPIADYDDMTAPELLPFLTPLSGDDLATVLRYEQTHRSRATVINRIRQLQG